MIVSYKWLQSYFKEPLPQPAELAELLTMKTFEVEGVETKNGDTVFDIKVLPDRSPYCLSHRYIAQEVGAIVRQEIIVSEINDVPVSEVSRKLSVKIDDVELCARYIGRVIEGIEIASSPQWLKTQLEVLGQRSINNIVDLTNFVMLELGQPMHAFDAEKVQGDIVVRLAKEGEEIVILDGTTIELKSSILVIADEVGPLAIAGVKGGKRAEITIGTKNIILEAANFKGSSVRRTSQTVGIRNDSSKRFENQVTPERAGVGMKMISSLINDLLPAAKFGEIVDQYSSPSVERYFDIQVSKVNSLLGCEIPSETVIDILKWCRIGVEKKDSDTLALTIPVYRSDLLALEDVADEVGRLYGYEKVPVRIPTPTFEQPINKSFFYKNLIREYLVEKGFSEVYTHTLKDDGDMVLENPLNAERGKLRNDISSVIAEKLEFNLRNVDLLGQTNVKIFEIGKVFGGKKEHLSLSVGIAQLKNTKDISVNEQIRNIHEYLISSLGINIQTVCVVDDLIMLKNKPIGEINKIDGVMEVDLIKIIEELPDVGADVNPSAGLPPLSQTTFKKISPYPFMVRDIAVFVSGEIGREGEVLDIIKQYGTDLLVMTSLFDTFTKKKEDELPRTSYAYRIVFQANDRTLIDQEVNSIMQKITEDMNSREGWQVR
ncbi:MAG: phenylalanine--tRNA ligase subunit beta [Patescibacteria group bacterium]